MCIEQRICRDDFIQVNLINNIPHQSAYKDHENNFEAYFNKSIFEGAEIALIAAVK